MTNGSTDKARTGVAGLDEADFGDVVEGRLDGLGWETEAGCAEFAGCHDSGAGIGGGLGDGGEVFPDGDPIFPGEGLIHAFAGGAK